MLLINYYTEHSNGTFIFEELPVFQDEPAYFSEEESEKEEVEIEVPKCNVCLDILGTCSEDLVALLCGHVLGRSCLERSLAADMERMHCPVCRKAIASREEIVKLYIDSSFFLSVVNLKKKVEKLKTENQLLAMELKNK